jgi:hypothetical protein
MRTIGTTRQQYNNSCALSNRLMVAVRQVLHVVALVHFENRLVKVVPVESPDFADHVVGEVVVPSLRVEIVDPAIINLVNILVTHKLSQWTST